MEVTSLCPSVGWLVCQSVIISLKGGKLQFNTPIGTLFDLLIIKKDMSSGLCKAGGSEPGGPNGGPGRGPEWY